MRKFFGWLVVILIVGLPVAYCVHLYDNYRKIQADLRRNSQRVVQPSVDDTSVSEIGYIFSIRRDTYIREGRLNLVWFIAVPETGSRYSCSYEAGFPDFKVGDGVRIIHKKDDVDNVDFTGYIIGLHEKEQGKTTEVWALDLDELEMDLDAQ
ncbi:MAG: hypothetical protein WBX09_09535 [Terracidiphilus sp.]